MTIQRSPDERRRNSYLLRKYGITLEQYDEMYERQQGCCAVCLRHSEEFTRRLAVDHNHKTREVRGLLCNYCNHRLIGRHTDADLLRRMASYLEVGTGWFTPEPKKKKKKKR